MARREGIYGEPSVPFLAQNWYSGQGDPLYALASAGWPQSIETVEWALRNVERDIAKLPKTKAAQKRSSLTQKDVEELFELEEGLKESLRRPKSEPWY